MSCMLGCTQAGHAQTGNEMEEGEVVDLTVTYKDHLGTIGPRPPKGPVEVVINIRSGNTFYAPMGSTVNITEGMIR